MKASKTAWVKVAVALAVTLWLLATLIESHLDTADRPPPPAVEPAAQPQRPSESLIPRDTERGAASCEASESRLESIIDDARACATDDDCTLFDYGYPLDCMTSVAKSAIPLLREEYRKYDETCEFRVFYDCPTEPFERLASCRNNRCVVELDTPDDLQDSTLEQMKRQGPRRE